MALTIYAESKLTMQHLLHIMLHRAEPSRIFCVPPFREGKIFKLHCGKANSSQCCVKGRMLCLARIYLDNQINY